MNSFFKNAGTAFFSVALLAMTLYAENAANVNIP